MEAFTCTGPLFRHTIAAHNFGEALQVARDELGGGRVVLWSTPDVWTRRAVEVALLPGVVDTVPRFVVERGGGFSGVLELDHDNLPGNPRPGEAEPLRRDSANHAAWLDAFEVVHAGGMALRGHVAMVATERDAATFTRLARALAGAYGLGPVPAWHAAILPALVALDIDGFIGSPIGLGSDVFDLDMVRLADRMSYAAEYGIGSRARVAARILRDALDHAAETDMRAASHKALVTLGWLPLAPLAVSA